MRLEVSSQPKFSTFEHVAGNCFRLDIPKLHRSEKSKNQPSVTVIRENDNVIGNHQSAMDAVVIKGRGAFVTTDQGILFSSSDNSNPNNNGRTYEVYVNTYSRGAFNGRTSPAADLPYRRIDGHSYIDMLSDSRLSKFFTEYQSRNHSPMRSLMASEDKAAIFLRIGHSGSNAALRSIAKSMPGFDFGMEGKAAQIEPGRSSYRMHYSHSELPVHHLISGSSSYFTFMRDPVRVFCSKYYHELSKGNGTFEADVTGRSLSFDEWLERIHRRPENHATVRYLTATRFLADLDEPWRVAYLRMIDGSGKRAARKISLPLVRKNLEKYFFFLGVTELFDESLFVLYLTMGVSMLPLWAHDTRSAVSAAAVLTADQRRLVEEIVDADIELYNDVRTAFEETYRREIGFFREHIKSLRGYLTWN